MNEATKRNEFIRILIADDHAVVREGLRTLIDTEPGTQVVGEAEDGVEVVQKESASSTRPGGQVEAGFDAPSNHTNSLTIGMIQ
jgi:hypothetical protein